MIRSVLGHPAVSTVLVVLCSTLGSSGAQTASITDPDPPGADGFKMGSARRPDGATVTLDSRSLLLNGKPWTPVMGEFHYTRYPETEWREELLKMKMGGVDIVSSYVFWIHHEEKEGEFDWSGRRNLRRFVQLCGEVGLKAVVRCGPWDHGEVRNGGFPDWLLEKGWKTRSDDSNYLGRVQRFYAEIARQLNGLLWKDGGPVIGIQVENEYSGTARHLLTLKRLAREAGLDVPLYTRTGWPSLSSPMPFGELVPLYGVYAEGFWDRELTPMPGSVYWAGFQFSALRGEGAFGSDLPGERKHRDGDASKYPYLSCEIGGGMMSSYHRRILVDPRDSESTTLVKLGSGGASLGYYMFHGGENPDGRFSTLMESQETGMWNDLPVKNYDFQTALGAYGQIRPQYHLLRRLHLFLHEWGPQLATMAAVMPDQRPQGRKDFNTLRWAVRSDGRSGFVFVNNYQRLHEMPAKTNVQFAINLMGHEFTFPESPVSAPANDCFIWPFNLDLANGITLAWATAQPLTTLHEPKRQTIFFSATKGVTPEFAFNKEAVGIRSAAGPVVQREGLAIARVNPGLGAALTLTAKDGGEVRIVVLDEPDALALYKGDWQGAERVFLSRAGLVLDGPDLRLTSPNLNGLQVGVYPAPAEVAAAGRAADSREEGIFRTFAPTGPCAVSFQASFETVQPAGPLRKIPLGQIDKPVAAAPVDADFKDAAVWRIRLPRDLNLNANPILRLRYVGDVARLTLNGHLLTDDFYNGNPLEVGLKRYAPEILAGELKLAVLPLTQDAPIYMAPEARPEFGKAKSVATLQQVEIIPSYQLVLTAR